MISSVWRLEGLGHWVTGKKASKLSVDHRVKLTVQTLRPDQDIFKLILLSAGHGEVPLGKVVLKPVPVVSCPAGEHDGLIVGWRELVVPQQLQVVAALRLWRVDTVRPPAGLGDRLWLPPSVPLTGDGCGGGVTVPRLVIETFPKCFTLELLDTFKGNLPVVIKESHLWVSLIDHIQVSLAAVYS